MLRNAEAFGIEGKTLGKHGTREWTGGGRRVAELSVRIQQDSCKQQYPLLQMPFLHIVVKRILTDGRFEACVPWVQLGFDDHSQIVQDLQSITNEVFSCTSLYVAQCTWKCFPKFSYLNLWLEFGVFQMAWFCFQRRRRSSQSLFPWILSVSPLVILQCAPIPVQFSKSQHNKSAKAIGSPQDWCVCFLQCFLTWQQTMNKKRQERDGSNLYIHQFQS